jgi:peptide/nickel transport system permease protein
MNNNQSLWNKIWHSGKRSRASVIVLSVMLLTALLSSLLASNKPIWIATNAGHFFPALSGMDVIPGNAEGTNQIDFRSSNWEQTPGINFIKAPIAWSPNASDSYDDGYSPPELERNKESNQPPHLLGTGKRGEDLLAGLIHGSKVSVTVGFLSMVIAGIIGIFLGALSGFFGDDKIKLTKGTLYMSIAGIIPAWFYSFHLRSYILEEALKTSTLTFLWELLLIKLIFILVIGLFAFAGMILSKVKFFNKKVPLKIDSTISRIIEIFISLPRLLLILSIAAIAKPSILNLVLIIGLTSWTEIARFTRAELLSIRNHDYILAARSMGLSEFRIMLRHALPNGISTALVALTFGVSAAILIESGLSFLGIGVPHDSVTWGSLLAAGRENFSAWWLVVFPGLAIFATVTALNFLGEAMREIWDPKNKC